MGISKLLGSVFASKVRDPFAGSESRSFASKPASQRPVTTGNPSGNARSKTFIVKTSAKGRLSETNSTAPLPLAEAIKAAVAFVETAPHDFLEVSREELISGVREAKVTIIDAQSGEHFAYLRACDEDMSLVHCLGTSSRSYFGRTSMPYVDPQYRYADIFKGAGGFSHAVTDGAFCDSDSEFAVFHRWAGLYPGHVSY